MEILLNGCPGGLSLVEDLMAEMYKRVGVKVVHCAPPFEKHLVVENDGAWLCFTAEKHRTSPLLISIVKEWKRQGRLVDNEHSKAIISDVDINRSWCIVSNYGVERIAYVDGKGNTDDTQRN